MRIAATSLLLLGSGLVLIHADPLPPQHCSRIETVSSIAAFDGLSPCIPTTPEELDAALSLQAETGLTLGSLDLASVNACLMRVAAKETLSPAVTEQCDKAITKLAEQGQSLTPSPASKVAHRLSEDPSFLCKCVGGIDVSGIKCTGFPVVSAIRTISQSCRLILSAEVQSEIQVTGDVTPTQKHKLPQAQAHAAEIIEAIPGTSGSLGRRNPSPQTQATQQGTQQGHVREDGSTQQQPQQQQQQQWQETAQQNLMRPGGEPQDAQGKQRNPSPSQPSQQAQPQQQQQQQQQWWQQSQQQQRPSQPQQAPPQQSQQQWQQQQQQNPNRPTDISQLSDGGRRCFDSFHAVCGGLGEIESRQCAKDAVEAQRLDPLCVMQILETSGSVRGGGGKQGGGVRGASPSPKPEAQRVDGHSCSSLVVARCMSVTSQKQLDACVHNLVQDGSMDRACMQYFK